MPPTSPRLEISAVRGVFGNIGRRVCLEISAEGCVWRYRQKGQHEAWCKTLSLRIQRFGTYPGERDPFEDILRPTCRIPMSNPQEANSSSSKLWEVTTLQPVALVRKQIVAPEMPRSMFRESKPDMSRAAAGIFRELFHSSRLVWTDLLGPPLRLSNDGGPRDAQ